MCELEINMIMSLFKEFEIIRILINSGQSAEIEANIELEPKFICSLEFAAFYYINDTLNM